MYQHHQVRDLILIRLVWTLVHQWNSIIVLQCHRISLFSMSYYLPISFTVFCKISYLVDLLSNFICPTHIALCFCFVLLRIVYPMMPVSLDCPLLIAPSVLSNVYSCTVFFRFFLCWTFHIISLTVLFKIFCLVDIPSNVYSVVLNLRMLGIILCPDTYKRPLPSLFIK